MPIYPLPQFEADVKQHLDEEDRKAYEALKAPKTIVVRFGVMKMVGEFPYAGTEKPGCGSKIVVKTHRGTELGEMLTSTCSNNGCSKSVSRKEMLQYIQNSGGREYPFSTEGRALRIAEVVDLNKSQQLEQSRHELRTIAKGVVERLGRTLKIVDAEPILGGETLTFYYLSEERIEVGDILDELRREFKGHIELRHVGARDEARITADYERCGQYCCCKNFLKVLKPVSMKSAKIQKATLDPLKISGRCGRLMCCLRYEDQTYEDLKKNLPRKKSRVGTPEGDGTVLDAQILTQLVLVELDRVASDGKTRQMAIPVEDLTPPLSATAPTDIEPYANPTRRPPMPMQRQPQSRGQATREINISNDDSRNISNSQSGDVALQRPQRPDNQRPDRGNQSRGSENTTAQPRDNRGDTRQRNQRSQGPRRRDDQPPRDQRNNRDGGSTTGDRVSRPELGENAQRMASSGGSYDAPVTSGDDGQRSGDMRSSGRASDEPNVTQRDGGNRNGRNRGPRRDFDRSGGRPRNTEPRSDGSSDAGSDRGQERGSDRRHGPNRGRGRGPDRGKRGGQQAPRGSDPDGSNNPPSGNPQ